MFYHLQCRLCSRGAVLHVQPSGRLKSLKNVYLAIFVFIRFSAASEWGFVEPPSQLCSYIARNDINTFDSTRGKTWPHMPPASKAAQGLKLIVSVAALLMVELPRQAPPRPPSATQSNHMNALDAPISRVHALGHGCCLHVENDDFCA